MSVKFAQTIARADSIQHLYDIFSNPVERLCRNTPASPPSAGGAKLVARDYKSMQFQTYSNAFGAAIRPFYPAHSYKSLTRKKRVPEEIH